MLGIYDSGLGGIHFARRLHLLEPNLDILVLADTQHLPLGQKTPEQIKQYAIEAVQTLFDRGCNLVVLACNTASVHSIRFIQQEWLPKYYPDKQVLGVTKPLIELIQKTLDPKKDFQLLGTQATINSNFYQTELNSLGYARGIYTICNGLADAIEQGDESAEEWVNKHLVLQSKHMALACTHYSLYIPQILHKINPELIIVDPVDFWLDRIGWYIKKHPEYPVARNGSYSELIQ